MKNIFSWAVLASTLLISTASAQNYRPFRPAVTYQLTEAATPGDTTHTLRLGSGLRVGADSVFQFNKRTSGGQNRNSGSCGSYVQRPDNLFGASLLVRPGAEYVLTAASGRTFTLRPRWPIGQAWPATAAGLTARVTARTLGTVLGQTDSLATITLSDGAVLTLGKRLGWVSGPALGHYLNRQLPQAALTLTALPELGLGTARTGPFVVYDFQPGDLFLRKTISLGMITPCAFPTAWTRDSIISRRLSTNGDTLVYQVRTRTLTTGCGSPILAAPTTQTLRIDRTARGVGQLTGYWEGPIHMPASRSTTFNQRPAQGHVNYGQCGTMLGDSTDLFNTAALDAGYTATSVAGLGLVQSIFSSFSAQFMFLMGYRKGSETWGQLTPFTQLLPTRTSQLAAAVAAYPNPFRAELTVQLTLASPQAVTAELHDALGRLVLARPAQLLGAGAQQLVLPTATLPAGLYTLHLRVAGEPRAEILKVVKTE
jgi:hypothetical protein